MRSCLDVASDHQLATVASPVLGAGNGRLPEDLALRTMIAEMAASRADIACRIVRFRLPFDPPSAHIAARRARPAVSRGRWRDTAPHHGLREEGQRES